MAPGDNHKINAISLDLDQAIKLMPIPPVINTFYRLLILPPINNNHRHTNKSIYFVWAIACL